MPQKMRLMQVNHIYNSSFTVMLCEVKYKYGVAFKRHLPNAIMFCILYFQMCTSLNLAKAELCLQLRLENDILV